MSESRASILQSDRRRSAILSRRISALQTGSIESCAVLEIGNCHLRAGASGECDPRCVLPLPESALQFSIEDHKVLTLSDAHLGELEDRIERSLREAVNRYLYVPLKGKKVVVVDDHLQSAAVRRVIARVLFTYHQPKELYFLHAGVCCTLALGVSSGIVIDIGMRECTIIPICDQRPLNTLVRSTRTAGSALTSRTRYLLERFSLPTLQALTHSDVLNFVSKALICLPRSPLPPDMSDSIANENLHDFYDVELYRDKTFTWTQPSAEQVIKLPIWIRFAIPEIFFEARNIYADSAYRSIPACVDSIAKSASIDLRPKLRQLVVTGSACAIPGLGSRLGRESGLLVLENVHGPDLAWVGASLATSLGISGPSLTMQQFITTRQVPDWTQRKLAHG